MLLFLPDQKFLTGAEKNKPFSIVCKTSTTKTSKTRKSIRN